LLLVFSFAAKGFCLGTPVCPQKPIFPNSSWNSNQLNKEPVLALNSYVLFIISFEIVFSVSNSCAQAGRIQNGLLCSCVTSFIFFQLLELGVSLEVLSVTSSNGGSFRFMGRKYLSEAVLTGEEGARTEDGGVLYAGDDGMVGLEEIKR